MEINYYYDYNFEVDVSVINIY